MRSRALVFAVPGDLSARTGGYEYDRRLIDALRGSGWSVTVLGLDASYPDPTPEARAEAAAALARIPDEALVVVDGLAFGAMAESARAEAARLRLVALVHHPLARETGLSPTRVGVLFESERAALACARHTVVTSEATARGLVEYGVPAGRCSVVVPGTDPAPLATGSAGEAINLLCVATVTARKGHLVLVDALAGLVDAPWRLTCAGALDRDADTTRLLRQALRDRGMEHRVELLGEVAESRLAELYASADVFVLPTLYEGYGMAVAEALARGLPVISTATGAIGELVQEDAGVLVPPGDVTALRAALVCLFDPATRKTYAEGARRRRAALPSWEDAGRRMAQVLELVRQA